MKRSGFREGMLALLITAIVVWSAFCIGQATIAVKQEAVGAPLYEWQQRSDGRRSVSAGEIIVSALLTWSGPTTALALLALLCQQSARKEA